MYLSSISNVFEFSLLKAVINVRYQRLLHFKMRQDSQVQITTPVRCFRLVNAGLPNYEEAFKTPGHLALLLVLSSTLHSMPIKDIFDLMGIEVVKFKNIKLLFNESAPHHLLAVLEKCYILRCVAFSVS